MITKHIVIATAAVTLFAAACGGGDSKAVPTRTGPVVSLAPVAGVRPGEAFTVSLRISNVQNLGGYQFTLDYDGAKVAVKGEEQGDFLGSTGREPVCQAKDDPGALLYACATREPKASQGSTTQSAPTAGPSGEGELLRIQLQAADNVSGTIDLQLAGVQVVDPLAQAIESSANGISIKVQ